MYKRRVKRSLDNPDVPLSKKLSVTSQHINTKSYFEEVIASCGFVCVTGKDPNILNCDQAVFVNNLKKKLRNHHSFPNNVKEFVEALETFVNDEDNLKKALSNTQTSEDCLNARGNTQSSLIQLLLSVDCVQSDLLKLLFEKLLEFSLIVGSHINDLEQYPWIRMILRQMRFLDNIVNPDTLNEQLNELLDAAPTPVQLEVIFCIPDIITDEQHCEIGSKLSDLVLEKTELTPVILDALSNLSLEKDLHLKVAERMLSVLRTAPTYYFPNIVKFLLTGKKQTDWNEILSGLRDGLDFTPLHETTENHASSETLTIAALRDAVLGARDVATAWLNIIENVSDASSHKTLDVIMLLVIYSSIPFLKKRVEAIFKNKMKMELFKTSLFEKLFKTFHVVMKEYHNTILSIAAMLLQSTDPSVSCHSAILFNLLLTHFDGHLNQTTLIKLIMHTCTGSSTTAKTGLSILSYMAETNISRLLPHQMLLLNLMNKLPSFDLWQAEQVMDILCRLAYSPFQTTCDILQDEIHMLVRKHVTSGSLIMKKKGVIGAVMAAKSIALRTSDDNQSETSSFEELSQGRMRQAIELMDLVIAGTKSYPEAQGLFFDELTVMAATTSDLHDSFILWINENLLVDFEDIFIKDVGELSLEKGFSLKYETNNDASMICLPLAQLLLENQKDASNTKTQHSVVILNPFLRLLRAIKYLTSNGDLDEIDGLLVCGVVMPEIEDIENFQCLDKDEKQIILDSIFFAINWFRELINAFVFQKSALLQEKVLVRLHNVMELQKTLASFLPLANPDYVPPPCQFYYEPDLADSPKNAISTKNVKKKKTKTGKRAGKKKKKNADASEDEGDNNLSVTKEDSSIVLASDSSSKALSDSVKHLYLRELDFDVLILLCKTLDLDGKMKLSIDAPTLLFLLEDYVGKLEHLYLPAKKPFGPKSSSSSLPIGFMNVKRQTPQSFLKTALKILPHLCLKLEQIAEYSQKLLENCDGILDAPGMFEDGSKEKKKCFALLIKSMDILFSWEGFHNHINVNYLRDGLKIFASRLSAENSELTSLDDLAQESIKYLRSYVKRTLDIFAACSLISLLENIKNYSSNKASLKKSIAKVSQVFLSQRWFSIEGPEEKGIIFNKQIKQLVHSYLANSANKLNTLVVLVEWVQKELEEEGGGKDWSLRTFPSIKRSNFHLLFEEMFSSLLEGSRESLTETSDKRASLEVWKTVVKILWGFESIVKIHEQGTLVIVVKMSHHILKLFLQKGMGVIDILLRQNRDEVTNLIKDLQKYNRFLHSLCFHSKTEMCVAATRYIPQMKQTLEQLKVHVKSVLAANGCISAYSAGNLRNRNLQGEVIPSQSSVNDDEESGTEEKAAESDIDPDEVAPNDSEKDESGAEGSDSVSEVF